MICAALSDTGTIQCSVKCNDTPGSKDPYSPLPSMPLLVPTLVSRSWLTSCTSGGHRAAYTFSFRRCFPRYATGTRRCTLTVLPSTFFHKQKAAFLLSESRSATEARCIAALTCTDHESHGLCVHCIASPPDCSTVHHVFHCTAQHCAVLYMPWYYMS